MRRMEFKMERSGLMQIGDEVGIIETEMENFLYYTIEHAYEQCSEEDSVTAEEELIHKLLEKKHFDREHATYEECQKMIGFLYRRGFVPDKIYKAVGRCEE